MIDVLTADEMRNIEAAQFAAGLDSYALMERAGLTAAEIIATRFPRARRIVVVTGPGNNGGDGFVIARDLAARGRTVTVAALVPPAAMRGDAARAAAAWPGPIIPIADIDPAGTDLVVDALFGIGLARALAGPAAEAVATVNAAAAHGVPIVAIDLPSGIDADSGAIRGIAVRATLTITFHRLKPGHVLEPGRSHTGEVTIADIGLTSPCAAATVNEPALWGDALPRLAVAAHKYTRGHALVLAGGLEGVGAARLAARAALRIGAGLVTLGVPPEAMIAHAARGPDALMARPVDGDDGLAVILSDVRRNAVLIGPAYGLGAATIAAVTTVLAARRATVLDADAITAFAGRAAELAAAIGDNRNVVLTPHAGEFARLFDASDAGKIIRTRTASARMGAVVVHKGPDTVVAAPDGRAAVNTNGTPHLATAGSGDVLAGVITGLLAQGMPAYEAACAAVHLHAAAATRLGAGLIADDLADAVRLPT